MMRLTRWILLVLGSALVSYAFVATGLARFGAGHAALVMLGVPLVAWGLFWKPLCACTASGFGHVLLNALRMGYVLVALALALCIALMVSANKKPPAPGADAVIVLGSGLKNGGVSLTLKLRLDAALVYLQDNPETLCVLSGGQGADEPISEAEAMRRYMQALGIDAPRLILEERSQNTNENIAFSRALLLERLAREPGVVIVSSDFHLFRGVALARGAGFINPGGLGGHSYPPILPVYAVRETLGILKDGLLGRF